MAGTDKARGRAVARAEQVKNAPAAQGQPTVQDLLKQLQPQIARALPAQMSADRFTRIVLTTLRTTPKLMQCDPQSLMAACMLSAQLGLEPGPLGHVYFVPYGREVQVILGYKGMMHLARQSGEIQSIEAREVCANDLFEFEFGLEPKLRHKPADGDRGAPTHYYGVAHFKDGGHYFEVLPISEVEKYRQRSATGKGANPSGPWGTDYAQMARKTCIRRMAPYLPLSTEAARAVEADEGMVVGNLPMDSDGEIEVSHDGNVIDVEPEPDEVEDDQAAGAGAADAEDDDPFTSGGGDA